MKERLTLKLWGIDVIRTPWISLTESAERQTSWAKVYGKDMSILVERNGAQALQQ